MRGARRVAVVVTARSSYARVQTVLEAIEERDDLELGLILAGSALLDRYGVVQQGVQIRPAEEIPCVFDGHTRGTSVRTTGWLMAELAGAFERLHPDVVVTVADRYETLATATAAAYLHLPLCHLQGGEVSGSIDEKVRHAVTKLADTHCVATALSATRVIGLGEDPRRVHLTGCPSIDLAARVLAAPRAPQQVLQEAGGVGPVPNLAAGYVIVLQHGVTQESQAAETQMQMTLDAVEASGETALVFWPNVDAGTDGIAKAIRRRREQGTRAPWHALRHLAAEPFLHLLLSATALIGNSSVGIREGSLLGVPVVNIGTRQTGRERGANVVDVPVLSPEAIAVALTHQLRVTRPAGVPLYGDGSAGPQIAQILATMPLTTTKRLP